MLTREDKVYLTTMSIFAIVGMFAFGYQMNYAKVKKEFIDKGINLGCLEYKLVDTKTGRTELTIVSEKKDELRELFEIPIASITVDCPKLLYSDHNPIVTLTTYTVPIGMYIATMTAEKTR